jgi:hypothetical protein
MAWVPAAITAGATIFDRLMGSGDKMNKVPTMSKPQQALLSQLMQMISPQGGLGQGAQQGVNLQQQLMDPSSQAVDQFAQPYMNQFNQQTIPGLAERFAGMGAMGGGLSSSGFGQSLSAAGGNLQNQLAQLKAGLGQNAAQSLMQQYGQMTGMGLNAQPFAYQQKAPTMGGGFMQGYSQAGFPGLSQAFSNFQGVGGGNSGAVGGTNPYNSPYAAMGNATAWR